MKVIGLSGGIAAGKDFVAKIFADNESIANGRGSIGHRLPVTFEMNAEI